MKLMKIITIIVIILFVSLTKKSLLPISKEIDKMEVLKLVGLDYNSKEKENKASLSFMMEKEEGAVGNSEQTKTEYQEVMTYKAMSFTEAVRQMQFYSDKNVAGSHVKYFLIGEKTAKNNIEDALDIISKDQETRMSGHIYLVKGQTTQEFLQQLAGLEYKVSEKLASMEEKSSEKSIVKFLTLSDLLSRKLAGPSIYLIPALEISSSEKLADVKGVEKEEKSNEKSFNFCGYGIMKEAKLIEYIDSKESIIYNMLINESEGGNIDIETKGGEIISFGMNDITTEYSFSFDDNKLKKINIVVNFRSNYEEVHTKSNIMYTNKIDEYEKLQEEKIKKQVEDLIAKSQSLGIDIVGIGQKIKIRHPYKFRNVKDSFEEDYKNAKINVKVEASIDRTYDVVEIN